LICEQLGTHWSDLIGAAEITAIAIIWIFVYLPKYGSADLQPLKWNSQANKYYSDHDMKVAADNELTEING